MTRAQKAKITAGVVADALRETATKLTSASKAELDYSPEGLARAVGRFQGLVDYEAERLQRLATMLTEAAA